MSAGGRAVAGPEFLRWLPSLRADPVLDPGEVTLLCVPYAGGSASLYRPWRAAAPAGIRVVPVQPPGRMERLREEPLRSAEALAEGLGRAVLDSGVRRYALFGISLGALVAYETAHWLTAAGLPPEHLVVASSPGPALPRPAQGAVHLGPDEQLVDVLAELGVTPPELLAHQEMRGLLLPVLRADFAVTETYVHRPRAALHAPVTVVHGAQDRYVGDEAARAWRRETRGAFQVRRLAAGHFVLPERSAEVLELVRAALAAPVGAPAQE
ncbi:thioesterase II family protein [Streptomyces sp. NPDC049687]|uniref:thioesterase II family protein n=1 Tax=Streptomyces sp. NPDC049687 TaxID=3365596 RepID=UPI00378E764C